MVRGNGYIYQSYRGNQYRNTQAARCKTPQKRTDTGLQNFPAYRHLGSPTGYDQRGGYDERNSGGYHEGYGGAGEGYGIISTHTKNNQYAH
jgi:hypothetical protein